MVEEKKTTEDVKATNTEPNTAPISPDANPLTDTIETTVKKPVGKKKSKKNAVARQVTQGRVYVKSTYNNTIITFTDQNGNVLAWSSAGQCGFKGPKKATPYAATMIVKDAFEKAKKHGLKEVAVFVKGIGGGREAAVRALNANGLNVAGIKDVTPIPHNGCRAKKARRV